MTKTKMVLRFLIAVAVLLLAVASSSDRGVQAKSQAKGAILTGTWFLTLPPPAGLSGFFTYHQDRTVSGVTSSAFGGPPLVGTFKSPDHGVWERAGRRRFESATYRFLFDPNTGDALGITRIRMEFSLDPGSESASGVFFVTQWTCPSPTECPDPNVTDPDEPEFAPPINTVTMTRVRLP